MNAAQKKKIADIIVNMMREDGGKDLHCGWGEWWLEEIGLKFKTVSKSSRCLIGQQRCRIGRSNQRRPRDTRKNIWINMKELKFEVDSKNFDEVWIELDRDFAMKVLVLGSFPETIPS